MAQQITVKEIRGPLGKGEKKFYAVVDDKGAEITTFDNKITALRPGTIIEADVEVSGKYVNLKEWKLISEPAIAMSATESAKPHMRDDRELRSIEAQVAYKGIIELAKEIMIAGTQAKIEVHADFQRVFTKALQWAENKLDGLPIKPAPSPAVTGTKSGPPKEETRTTPPFKSVGDLLTWCSKQGISRAKAMEIWQVKEEDLPNINVPDAHQAILDFLKEHAIAKP